MMEKETAVVITPLIGMLLQGHSKECRMPWLHLRSHPDLSFEIIKNTKFLEVTNQQLLWWFRLLKFNYSVRWGKNMQIDGKRIVPVT